MAVFEQIGWHEIEWDKLDNYADRTVFQSKAWLEFIAHSQRAEPIVLQIRDGTTPVGYFTGAIVRKWGVPILGSPLAGWTTAYMGFNLNEYVNRSELIPGLLDFSFKHLGCAHIEFMDRKLKIDAAERLQLSHVILSGFEIDLKKSQHELFSSMTSACRRCIRKAEKSNIRIEEVDCLKFAEEYYAQLRDVFAKQGLVPTYDVERVRALIRHVQPTGNLLLLRAVDSEGTSIATGVFPAFNDTMYFWGGASWRAYQGLRPNEALQWYAMRYWKNRGIHLYDMGGGGEYKRKYGGREIAVPWYRVSKYPFLEHGRTLIQKSVRLKQIIVAKTQTLD